MHFFFATLFFWNILAGGEPTVTASFRDMNFHLEVADELYELRHGLMSRIYLPPNRGMIFAYFDERKRSFWMKNTLFPMDLIFLDHEKRVVDFRENFQPCRSDPCEIYTSQGPAEFVVELNGGMIEVMRLRKGDQFFVLKGLF